jgi:cytochrome P450
VVARRRAHPSDDLLSVVVTSEIDGERLSELDAVMFGFTLLVAGNETTRNLLSNGLVALAEHPDQRAALAGADDAAMTRAVDELLRWEPPIVVMGRTTVDDEVIGGVAVERGSYLALLYPSANRDESVFGPTATQLDLTRDPNPHLAFGVGEHFCLGAGLARLEGRVLLGELLARWPGYEVTGPPARLPSTLVRAIERLPVVLAP